jgi:hypothetical protein
VADAHGLLRITRGKGQVRGFVADCFGLPCAASRVPVHLHIEPVRGGEKWRRLFGTQVLETRQWAHNGVLEILITLMDFLEEDRTRKLPAGERAGHAVMGIVYGLFLAYVVPEIWRWTSLPTGIGVVDHSPVAWLLSIMAVGVLSFGIRDLVGARRLRGLGPL